MKVEILAERDWGPLLAARLAARLHDRPGLTLCLPTGTTPRPLYAHLDDALRAADTSMAQTTVVVLDEFGGLDPEDPARCANLIQRDLLDRLTVAPARVLVPDVDAPDPEQAGARYEAQINELGGIDLALLGLGANGHVGMNEPGSPPSSRTRTVELADSTSRHAAEYGAVVPPRWGITLGLGTILEARELWLLVRGAHKRDILQRATKGETDPSVPASMLRDHPRLTVLADRAAMPSPSAA